MKATAPWRILYISIACLLVVFMAACSTTTAPTQAPATSAAAEQTTQPAQTAQPTATPSAAPAVSTDPVTLTVGIQSANCTFGDGIHQEYSVMKDITDKTGVTMNFVTYDQEKFKVLVAGGDLPDLISIEANSGSMTSSLIQSGALLALDDLLGKYGQNIEKNIPTGLAWSKNVIGNGKTYILPTNTSVADPDNPKELGWVGFFSRYDIYKAIGSPKMTGEDDYLNVLKQMQDYARKQSGNNKVYALSAWSDWGLWPYWVSYPFSYGYKDCNINHLVNMQTGDIEHEFLDENGIFWKALKFYNKAYQMGIFDPEGLTMKYAQYADKCTNGTVLTAAAEWLQPDTKLCGDNALNVMLPGAFPDLNQIFPIGTKIGYGLGGARCINANCKSPDRAMQLLNWLDSEEGARVVANGVKGVDWDVVDGKAQLIDDRLKAYQNNTLNDYEQKNPSGIAGANFVSLSQFYTSGTFKTSDGQPINLSTSQSFIASVASARDKAFAQDYDASLSYPGQVYSKWVKDGTEKSPANTPLAAELIGALSADSTQIENNVSEYFVGNISKIIMAKTDTEFESIKASMITAIKAMGVEKSNHEFMQLYAAAQKLASTLGN